jgi:hypothetical protein
MQKIKQQMRETHFTIKQLSQMWALSYGSILRMFQDEPGVLKLGSRSTRRRTRISLRIPESVARDVYARRSR